MIIGVRDATGAKLEVRFREANAGGPPLDAIRELREPEREPRVEDVVERGGVDSFEERRSPRRTWVADDFSDVEGRAIEISDFGLEDFFSLGDDDQPNGLGGFVGVVVLYSELLSDVRAIIFQRVFGRIFGGDG